MNATDLEIFWNINRQWTHPFLDWLMPALSAIEAWLPILLLLLVILAWRGNANLRWALLAIGLAITLGDAVLGRTLKKSLGRVRPRDSMSGVVMRDLANIKPRTLALLQPPVIKLSNVKKPMTEGNSIPSNHTINLFAVAYVFLGLSRRWGIPVLLLAASVAYSRVYVGAHWPSDIPPSIGLGLVAGWLGVSLQRLIQRRCSAD
jgi:undecaprenyl-diphosphatase